MDSDDTSKQTDSQTVVEAMKDLAAKNINGSMQLVSRIVGLAKDAGKEFGTQLGKRPLPRRQEIITRWLDLNVAYYSLLTEHSLAFINDFVSAAEITLGIKPKTQQQARQATATPQSKIVVSGRIGEMATALFLVENHHAGPLEIAIQASDFVSLKGEVIPARHVTFDPNILVLQPKQQAVVKVMVSIDEEFKASETYVTLIKVVGFDDKEIALVLTVLPPVGREINKV